MQCWRRHISTSSFWEGWWSLERAPASSDHSTPALWRASWPAASPPGLETAPLATTKLCKGSCELPATLLEVSFPPPGHLHQGCTRKARRFIKDSSHPSHRLLSLLPSGRCLRSMSCTSWLRHSFSPLANEQSEITHPTSHSHSHNMPYCTLTQFYRTTRTHCTNTSAITGHHTKHIHDIAYA